MRKKSFKGRCEKRVLGKCAEMCRTYDAVQYAYDSFFYAVVRQFIYLIYLLAAATILSIWTLRSNRTQPAACSSIRTSPERSAWNNCERIASRTKFPAR